MKVFVNLVMVILLMGVAFISVPETSLVGAILFLFSFAVFLLLTMWDF